jgi:hypothetical protein
MKMQKLLALALGVITLATSAIAVPVPVLLNTLALPGTQPANAGDGTVADWLDSLIPGGDQIGSGAALLVNKNDVAPSGYPSFGDGVNPITLPLGVYDYLVLHWGGSGGGVFYAYDISAFAPGESYTFAPEDGRNNGLSFYRFYNPSTTTTVPDAGSTLVLFGAGLATLGAFARRMR